MLGLRCRFSTLDLRSRFTTPTKLSHFVSLQFHFVEVAFHHPNDWGILLPSQNGYANKLTVYGYPYSSSSSSVSKIAPRTLVNVISADSSFLDINFLWYNVAISSSNFWILVNSALSSVSLLWILVSSFLI